MPKCCRKKKNIWTRLSEFSLSSQLLLSYFSAAAAAVPVKMFSENTKLIKYACEYEPVWDLFWSPSFCVSLSLSSPPRFTIPESAKIDTVLGNLTVFEYLENKVGIRFFFSFAHQSRRLTPCCMSWVYFTRCHNYMFKLIMMCFMRGLRVPFCASLCSLSSFL